MWVKPQQTATTPAEAQDLVVRMVCHMLLDALPFRAAYELILTLIEMRQHFSQHLATGANDHWRWLFELPPGGGRAFSADDAPAPVHESADRAQRFFQQLSKLRVDRSREHLDLNEED
jgi:hypothetical protein